MKPPYFGYFDLDRKSDAETFDECLNECGGNLEMFFPIEEFIHFYHDEDNFEAFTYNENFRFFCPDDESYDIYNYSGEACKDKFTLNDGKRYYCDEWSEYIYPVNEDEEDCEDPDSGIRLADVIEDEFGHLSAEYPLLFKRLTLDEFQKLLHETYPLVICIKKRINEVK